MAPAPSPHLVPGLPGPRPFPHPAKWAATLNAAPPRTGPTCCAFLPPANASVLDLPKGLGTRCLSPLP